MQDGRAERERETWAFGPYRLDPIARLLRKEDRDVEIGSRALDILIELVAQAGDVVDKRVLMDRVWRGVTVGEGNLRVHLTSLRRVLGDGVDGTRYVVNVSGRGYSFVAPVERIANPAAPPPQVTVRLPPSPTPLIGREEAVADLAAEILARRFVSVVGPAGMGKTTVAVAAARALLPEFANRYLAFVDLAAVTDPDDVAGAIAAELGIPPTPAGVADLMSRRTLLVLDNCEHVVGIVAQLTENLFAKGQTLHMLATSREALRARGENLYFLRPLAAPTSPAPTAVQALAAPAVQLFMDRAAAGGYRDELSDPDAPAVADICRRMEGLALAIELVATRASAHGIRGLAGLLDDGTALALRGRRHAAARHQTLEAMLDWSFDLLEPHERTVFIRLASFVGPFTAEAAETVAGGDVPVPVRQILIDLTDKFLLSVQDVKGHALFRMLETTRVFAAAKLQQSGEHEEIALRHATYFTDLLSRTADGPAPGAPDLPALQIGSLRRALEWAFAEPERHEVGLQLAVGAVALMMRLSLLSECRRWCERALAALADDQLGSETELALQESLATSGMFSRAFDAKVRQSIERGLQISDGLGETRRQLNLLAGLNLLLSGRGEFDQALVAAERYRVVAGETGSAVEMTLAEWMVAASHHLVGDQALALDHYRLGFDLEAKTEKLRISQFGYDHRTRAVIGLARTSLVHGLPDQARDHAVRGIEEASKLDPVSHNIAINYSVPIFLWRGEYDEAAEFIATALATASANSLLPHRTLARAREGQRLVMMGEAAKGVPILRESLDEMNVGGHRIAVSAVSRSLAEGLLRLDQPEAALTVINRALSQAESTGERLRLADLMRCRGEILMAQPEPDLAAAETALTGAIALARTQSAMGYGLHAASALARLRERQDRFAEAVAILSEAYASFTEGFATAPLKAARQQLDRLEQNRFGEPSGKASD